MHASPRLAGAHEAEEWQGHPDPMGRWGASGRIATLTRDPAAFTFLCMDSTAGFEPVITLTPYALEMAKKVRAREGLSDQHALRVAVVGGGCSGFSYQLDFDDKAQDDDRVIECDGVQVRVEATSAQ